ncbi:hypothetical protein RD792_005430 [Penstemon davidsonii]|uniref:Uncharacterized protein n=1 Tax=Penstemon davidsonii TaxID=160366 RepID=A0ABR0DK47_9LAMI|nr:hypothetical protein RD792_005430 [Penstemon davidsonii]
MISKTFHDTAQYYAPQVENTNVSQASDVSNFGILLLELLTRKSSNQDFDIVMWVNSVKRKEWSAKVFDVDLLKNPAIEDQMDATIVAVKRLKEVIVVKEEFEQQMNIVGNSLIGTLHPRNMPFWLFATSN